MNDELFQSVRVTCEGKAWSAAGNAKQLSSDPDHPAGSSLSCPGE